MPYSLYLSRLTPHVSGIQPLSLQLRSAGGALGQVLSACNQQCPASGQCSSSSSGTPACGLATLSRHVGSVKDVTTQISSPGQQQLSKSSVQPSIVGTNNETGPVSGRLPLPPWRQQQQPTELQCRQFQSTAHSTPHTPSWPPFRHQQGPALPSTWLLCGLPSYLGPQHHPYSTCSTPSSTCPQVQLADSSSCTNSLPFSSTIAITSNFSSNTHAPSVAAAAAAARSRSAGVISHAASSSYRPSTTSTGSFNTDGTSSSSSGSSSDRTGSNPTDSAAAGSSSSSSAGMSAGTSDGPTNNSSGSSGGGSSSSSTWVDRLLPPGARPYAQLMRLEKPVGSWLLAWPGLWSIALAAPPGSWPDPWYCLLFSVGAVLLRGAGCTINDLWDRDIDKMVERTRNRPLAAGVVTPLQALLFLGAQLSLGLGILLQLNTYTQVLGASSLLLVATYPAMKRVTWWPQAFLGATFNWGALMGWAAVQGSCDWSVVLPLYAAGINWTLVYDTIYAHQDKKDDEVAGVKSTARLFGTRTKPILSGFAVAQTGLLLAAGDAAGCSSIWQAAVALGAAHQAWQISSVDLSQPEQCMRVFVSNKWYGAILFAGVVGDRLLM